MLVFSLIMVGYTQQATRGWCVKSGTCKLYADRALGQLPTQPSIPGGR